MDDNDKNVNVSWQWVATTVFGLLTTLLMALLFDMRSDLTKVKTTADNNEWMVKYVGGLQAQAEVKAERLVKLENKIDYIGDRLTTMSARILSVSQRQDKCGCKDGGAYEMPAEGGGVYESRYGCTVYSTKYWEYEAVYPWLVHCSVQ
jgi:hypothetical protein